jgi:hypothetical protein
MDAAFLWAGKALGLGLAALVIGLVWYWAINRIAAAAGWTWLLAERAVKSRFWSRWFGYAHQGEE